MSKTSIKRIVTIEGDYARDTQIFAADPAIIEKDPEWENNFLDAKYPNLYIGIYEGVSEKEIREKAAADLGVHPGVITLAEIDRKSDVVPTTSAGRVIVGRAINGVTINGLEYLTNDEGEIMKFPDVKAAKMFLLDNGVSQDEIEDMRFLDAESEELMPWHICPVCKNEDHPSNARFCKICGNPIPLPQQKNDDASAVSGHVFTDEDVRQLKQKREYTKDESEAGVCPKCGGAILGYGTSELVDTYIEYPWKCNSCGSTGKEYGAIEFDGHYIDTSPDLLN